jgi:hypothetical protein
MMPDIVIASMLSFVAGGFASLKNAANADGLFQMMRRGNLQG